MRAHAHLRPAPPRTGWATCRAPRRRSRASGAPCSRRGASAGTPADVCTVAVVVEARHAGEVRLGSPSHASGRQRAAALAHLERRAARRRLLVRVARDVLRDGRGAAGSTMSGRRTAEAGARREYSPNTCVASPQVPGTAIPCSLHTHQVCEADVDVAERPNVPDAHVQRRRKCRSPVDERAGRCGGGVGDGQTSDADAGGCRWGRGGGGGHSQNGLRGTSPAVRTCAPQ